ncbi:MAG TPA: AMIN domain-containing protein, partial [Leptolyngbyaceae cyanobacterium]
MVALIVLASSTAQAAVLSSWSFEPNSQQLSITLPKGVVPRFLVFAEPTRIVLEVPSTQMGPMVTKQSYFGAVQAVEVTQHDADTVHISLILAPGTVIDRRHADLLATDAGGQTQWTLTPLVVGDTPSIAGEPEPTPALLAPLAQAQADLPPLPSIDSNPTTLPPTNSLEAAPEGQTVPNPRFVQTPEGQLSIAASNLMLPPASDRLVELPDTLPVDPFSTSFAPSTQVSVPSLEETVTASNSSPVSVPGLNEVAVPLTVEPADAANSPIATPNLPEPALSEPEIAAGAPVAGSSETMDAIASQPLASTPPTSTAPVLPSSSVPATAEGAIGIEPPTAEIATARVDAPPVEPSPVEPSSEVAPAEPPFLEAPLESASASPIALPESAQASVEPPVEMPSEAA